MKRAVWLTDPHLNFLSETRLPTFLDEVASARPDAVLISGDIGESHNVCEYLGLMLGSLGVPIYFVLGNHDFYYGSIRGTRERVSDFCKQHPRLHYLSIENAQELTSRVGLVGHDGWADGRLGDYRRSMVRMLDWKLIEEFSGRDAEARWEVLKRLADEAAAHIRRVLPEALARHDEVLMVTHVPPFLGACWHEGAISNDQWSPHFTSQVMGDAILEIMDGEPGKKLTVLCGHTHGEGEFEAADNVLVLTGGADYGSPRVVRVFELE